MKRIAKLAALAACLIPAGWLAAQSVKVNPIPDLDPNFIKGADVSSLLSIEAQGGKYYDENGKPGDALAILKDHGVNWVRIRLWNDPTNAADVVENGKVLSKKGEPSGGGNNNLATDLVLAKRAKALGLKFLLDFHYSDFWADPKSQDIPKAWKGLDQDGLQKTLYDFTKASLKAFADEGALPDMVQLGNETNGGMLWPVGKTYQSTPDEKIGGLDAFAALLGAGAKAVRETDPGIKIMIHLADGGDHGLYRYMFDELTKRDVDYDVIGFSYYPYWHGPLDQLADNLNAVSVRYSKPVMVAETAYAWTLADAPGTSNSFGPGLDKTGGYKATIQGQASEIRDVMAAVADVPGGQGLGVFYWDPLSLPVPDSGWRTGESNTRANQTLFDFKGKALPSMSVFNMVSGNQPSVDPVAVSVPPIKLTLALDQKTWDYPAQVLALYSDDAYHMADVSWTALDRQTVTKPQTVTLRGVVTGSKVPAVAVVNVVPMANLLSDPSFESGSLGDWKVSGTPQTAVVEKNPGNARTGDYSLKYWHDKDFNFTVTRDLDGLKDGIYSVKIWAMGGGGEKAITWQAQSAGQDPVQTLVHNTGWLKWNQYALRNVVVKGGKLTLSITVDGREGSWGNFDDIELVREGDSK